MKIGFIGLLALTLIPAVVSVAAPDDKTEPSAQYSLQISGKTVALTLDQEVEFESAGGPLRLKLALNPLRQFDKSGVMFRYPVGYSFQVESEPGVTIWTMNGNNSIVMLQRFPLAPASVVRQSMRDGLVENYGRKNVVMTATSLQTSQQKIAGDRITVSLAKQLLIQEIFAFTTAKNSFILLIQDTPLPESGATAEFKRLKTLVGESLHYQSSDPGQKTLNRVAKSSDFGVSPALSR